MTTNTALVPLDDDASLGPMMRALPTDRMRAFVRVLVSSGGTAKDAAQAAGYSAASSNSLVACASNLTRDPRIQAALHEEALKAIGADVPMALRVLRDVAKDPANAPRDRIKAAEAILSRGGLSTIVRQDINVVHSLSEGEKDREIKALAAELGLDNAATSKLLGKTIVDAEFVEIVDPPTDTAPPRDVRGGKIRVPERAEARADARARFAETPEQKIARRARTSLERKARSKAKFAQAQATREGPEDELDRLIWT